jgi:Na+/phosphate symporter
MDLVGSTETAMLLELKLGRGGPLVLEGGVILSLALGADQMNQIGHGGVP